MNHTRARSILYPVLSAVLLVLSISACSTRLTDIQSDEQRAISSPINQPNQHPRPNTIQGSLRCWQPERYASQVVGDGHCVALIKACTNAPNTSNWRPGKLAVEQALPRGTVIATFKGNRYPNRSGWHAAIYSHQDRHGIWVWDQWQGKSVGLRLIRHQVSRGAKLANRAGNYRIVLVD